MPLYEFRCPKGHEFEKFYRSINVAAIEEECPDCGEIAVRVMSTAGLVFKGSGFYITDYGKDGKKAERDAVASEKTKSEAAAAAKTPEAKGSEGAGGQADSAPAEKTKPAESGSAAKPAPRTEPKAEPRAEPKKPAPGSKAAE